MPRTGLTAERVVVEAGAIADEVGLERLTLTAVAHRFGVSVPSLYKHVKGRDALRAIADAYRTYAHAHPGLVAAKQVG